MMPRIFARRDAEREINVSYSFFLGVGMKHAILGAGAIGGLVGTALASLGEDVTILVRPEKFASYPRDLLLERPASLAL